MKQILHLLRGWLWLMLMAIFAWLLPQTVAADDTYVENTGNYSITLTGSNVIAIDALIATLYQFDIMYFETVDEYTNDMLTEIWIRPTITYGLVACFVTEVEK